MTFAVITEDENSFILIIKIDNPNVKLCVWLHHWSKSDARIIEISNIKFYFIANAKDLEIQEVHYFDSRGLQF